MSNVVVSGGIRNSLFALQDTSNTAAGIQKKLATGLKVGSALDGAQSFFAAQGLNNKANDLGRLLDAMGQSLQTIKAADNAVTSMSKLVEQADSIATQARDALASGSAEAKFTGTKDLRGVKDLTALNGVTNTDNLDFTVIDANGEEEVLTGGGSVAIATGDSIDQLITKINDVQDADGNQVLSARLDESGKLEVKALNGASMRMVVDATVADTDVADIGLASALGLPTKIVQDGVANAGGRTGTVELTAVAKPSLTSFKLTDGNGDVATRSTALSAIRKAGDTATALVSADNAADTFTISVNGGTTQSTTLNGGTIQSLIDGINSDMKGKVEASFNEETGEISLKALDASVKSIELGVTSDGTAATGNLGFGIQTFTAVTASQTKMESIQLGAASGQLAKLEGDYNKVLSQMDELAKDSGYRGTNLLNGDKLTTFFNDDRSSKIETQGQKLNADGLGLKKADFSRESTVDTSLSQIKAATSTLRDFGASLAADLGVIQNRQDFSKKTIDTLKEGADKLTVADANEEGAKLTSLQTRQQLAVITLSMASQSDQSVLRLF